MNILHTLLAALVLGTTLAVCFGVRRSDLVFTIVIGVTLVILLLMPHLQM